MAFSSDPKLLASRRKKGREMRIRRKARKGKGKGAPAIGAGIFSFPRQFLKLIRQYVTNHKEGALLSMVQT